MTLVLICECINYQVEGLMRGEARATSSAWSANSWDHSSVPIRLPQSLMNMIAIFLVAQVHGPNQRSLQDFDSFGPAQAPGCFLNLTSTSERKTVKTTLTDDLGAHNPRSPI